MIDQKRYGYIDLYRGIGIVLMIVGHVGFGDSVDHFIHAFHMPMFFIISGYLYSENNNGLLSNIKKKIRTLLVPYFAFGILLNTIWYFFIVKCHEIKSLLMIIAFNMTETKISGALWFLIALFWVNVLHLCFVEIFKDKLIIEHLIVICLSIVGIYLNDIFSFKIPFAVAPALVGLGFFYAGIIMKKFYGKYLNKDNGINILLLLTMTVVFIILIFKNGYVNMNLGMYSNVILFWINAFGSSGLILLFSVELDAFCNNKKVMKNLIYIFKTIGKNSIMYVCMNQSVILFLKANCFIESKNTICLLLIRGTILIVTIIILWFMDVLIRKTPFKVFIGAK